MSDQNIKVGDRCEVVKWPCCGQGLGAKLTVTNIVSDGAHCLCNKCDEISITSGCWVRDHTLPRNVEIVICAPMEWVRKLPDLTEGETTETVVKKPVTV